MKIMIFMAVSVDGYISGPNGETPWSNDEWENYARYTKDADGLIIGRRTYELMAKHDEFTRLNNPPYIVVGKNHEATTPQVAIHLAQEKKWRNIIVGGGQQLNSSFIENGIATHVHLDVEPVLLMSGTTLFLPGPRTIALEPLSQKQLTSGTLSCDYKIMF